MTSASDIRRAHLLADLTREARWAATTWHLLGIASYARTPEYSRKEASRFGWGKKARHSVNALSKIYFGYGQTAFLGTVRIHAPTLYEELCLCECHHGVDGTFCDCCDDYGTACFCHCHFCVHCDIESNRCAGEEECECDCHGSDCCDECQGCCWCQCHNCLECSGPDSECGDSCGCNCHESCNDCSGRHATDEDDEEDSCECDCHGCGGCYNCSSDCECDCHICCADCKECDCDCHDCDDCEDCYECSCECHECCDDCKDDDSDDDDENYYQPPVNKIERVSERIQQVLGVSLSIKETDQIEGQRIQAGAYPDNTIKVTRELASRMTDDELAFIIGHEYAHVEQKHIAKQLASRVAKRAGLRQGLSELDDHLKQKGSGKIKRVATHLICGALGEAGVALTGQIESQHYETKADERAIEIAAAAGYNPEASVTAYEKLHGGRVPEIGLVQSITSSHPAPRSRHQHLNRKSKRRT